MTTVTVLGSSGSYACPANPATGYLVRSGDTSVLVDCGPGTLGPLQEHVALASLSAVVVSHEHPDHWNELPVLFNALRYYLDRTDLPVYLTAGTLEIAGGFWARTGAAPTLRTTVIDADSQVTVDGLSLRFSRTDHGPETLAVRIDDPGGRSLAYSADTGPGWSMASLGPGIDLGIWEATVLDRDRHLAGDYHCSAAATGRAAREAGLGRLMLTHLLPGAGRPEEFAAEAAAEYGAPVEVARPGATYEV